MTAIEATYGWEPTTFSAVYHGKFSYAHYAKDENIWAVFPAGLRTGAPFYVMATFTKNAQGIENAPYQGLKPKLIVNHQDRTFSAKVEPGSSVDQYYWFEGTWSSDGQTLELQMYNKPGDKLDKYTLQLQGTA
ncbi:hypothetical protein Asppvi_003495 [Aspergillus pseudoviridinutans]|uniref:Uncharacterized protein n=1 Tax=Aspergillus pseudoviridinutans TaxID=1517512 RepID=A0A9P3B4L1_9EURO|nr:uncharacterized protein Asppvi_003495 [Aspergillus pseudoviridinutans]GIJ84646.1 hypothetical protein Asppvi_003495 [Aspergillus pseudoviridinutans]